MFNKKKEIAIFIGNRAEYGLRCIPVFSGFE